MAVMRMATKRSRCIRVLAGSTFDARRKVGVIGEMYTEIKGLRGGMAH